MNDDIRTCYRRVRLGGVERYVIVQPSGRLQPLSDAPWLGGGPVGKTLQPGVDVELEPAWLCPVVPSKIIGIGRNYRAHAAELDNAVPKEPLMFFKPPSSLIASGQSVVLPAQSERVDYEGELAVIIGQRVRRSSETRARSAIFGFAVCCDVTARDLQRKDKTWVRGKGMDTFCPLGPDVVSGVDPSAASLQLMVNGVKRQDGNTRDMIFDVPTLIAYVSQAMTLEPGDVILTGTPEGVGPLADGDAVVVSVEGVGTLRFDATKET